MTDGPRVSVSLDLPQWVADALMRWPVPEEYAGGDLAARVAFAAELAADGVMSGENNQTRRALYGKFGVAFPDGEDDDIPL